MGFIKLKIVPSMAQTVFMAREEYSRRLVLQTLIKFFISVWGQLLGGISINLLENIILVIFVLNFVIIKKTRMNS